MEFNTDDTCLKSFLISEGFLSHFTRKESVELTRNLNFDDLTDDAISKLASWKLYMKGSKIIKEYRRHFREARRLHCRNQLVNYTLTYLEGDYKVLSLADCYLDYLEKKGVKGVKDRTFKLNEKYTVVGKLRYLRYIVRKDASFVKLLRFLWNSEFFYMPSFL